MLRVFVKSADSSDGNKQRSLKSGDLSDGAQLVSSPLLKRGHSKVADGFVQLQTTCYAPAVVSR